LAADHHTLRHVNHLVGFFRQHVFAVKALLQHRRIERVEHVFLRLLEPYLRQRAAGHKPGHLIEHLARPLDERIALIRLQSGDAGGKGSLRCSLSRRRCRGKDKYRQGRERGESEKHAYIYSTIAVEGEFLPHTELKNITNPATDENEPAWRIAVNAALDKKATEIRILDLTGITSFTDYFVICTGANTRQTQAITDEIQLRLKKAGERPISVEGYDQGDWILSDYADFLVHVFTPKSREYYSLERLWKEAKDIPAPEETPGRQA